MAVGADIRAMIDMVESEPGVRLSPTERLLLATDGTVTHMLEALVRGHVEVDILNRNVVDTTLMRDVVLRRGATGTPLVWARSLVYLDRLPGEVADELVSGDTGIGDLLRNECEETRRQIETMDCLTVGEDDIPTFVAADADQYLVRKYNIYSGGSEVMTITELFPRRNF